MTPQRGVVLMAERTHTKEQAAGRRARAGRVRAWSEAPLEAVVTRQAHVSYLAFKSFN